MDKFKEVILETIKEVEQDGDEKKPLIFKWTYPEAPNWEIVLGMRKLDNDTVS